jgi:hypothetical protein
VRLHCLGGSDRLPAQGEPAQGQAGGTQSSTTVLAQVLVPLGIFYWRRSRGTLCEHDRQDVQADRQSERQPAAECWWVGENELGIWGLGWSLGGSGGGRGVISGLPFQRFQYRFQSLAPQ